MTTPYDKTPTVSIPGYSSDGTSITVPISSLHVTSGDVRTALSSDDAATSGGDIAEVLFGILNRIFKRYDEATTQPTKWSMFRTTSASGTTGFVSFGVTFQTSIPTPPTQTVQDEPTV